MLNIAKFLFIQQSLATLLALEEIKVHHYPINPTNTTLPIGDTLILKGGHPGKHIESDHQSQTVSKVKVKTETTSSTGDETVNKNRSNLGMILGLTSLALCIVCYAGMCQCHDRNDDGFLNYTTQEERRNAKKTLKQPISHIQQPAYNSL